MPSLSLDQGIFGPSNVAFFFVASGLLEGRSSHEIHQKLDQRLWQTISSAWLLWVSHTLHILRILTDNQVPFQFITFSIRDYVVVCDIANMPGYIPSRYRLVSGQAVAIGWNCFM